MRVAFLGKGGSGKTTLTASFIKYLQHENKQILAIDADVNSHLYREIGLKHNPKHLSESMEAISSYVRGERDDLGERPMISTTPPHPKSKFVRLDRDARFISSLGYGEGNVHFLNIGGYGDDDIGYTCYHGKLGALILLLNHLVDQKDDYVVIDSTTGTDIVGTALTHQYDLYCIVVEPTRYSVEVYDDFVAATKGLGIKILPIANKVRAPGDKQFLETALGVEFDESNTVRYSPDLRKYERAELSDTDGFVGENTPVLKNIDETLRGIDRDWQHYFSHVVDSHKKKAQKYYNSYTGQSLDDVEFVFPYEG